MNNDIIFTENSNITNASSYKILQSAFDIKLNTCNKENLNITDKKSGDNT